MTKEKLEIVSLNETNLEEEHICCAIGTDKINSRRAALKKNWLEERFQEGHTFKKFNVRGKVFIEYVPAEYAWFPIEAPGYSFIQCFWVSGRYKGRGLGAKLLEDCIQDCHHKNGIIAITSHKKRPFLPDKKFFTKYGFVVCDMADPYFELVVKKLKKDVPDPQFMDQARHPKLPGKKGVTIFFSDLCPFNADFVDVMIVTAQKYSLPCEKIKIESLNQAKTLPAPWGSFSVFYNEDFLTHEVMSAKKFDKLLTSLL